MLKIETFNTMDGCRDAFIKWWNDGGESSRAKQFDDAARVVTDPIANTAGIYDVTAMEELMDLHLGQHGRLVEWRPAAEDFLQQAEAISTSNLIEDGEKGDAMRLGWNETRSLMRGETHGFRRIVESLDRLSSTLDKRIDALRTMISAEKQRWGHEMSGNIKRSEP